MKTEPIEQVRVRLLGGPCDGYDDEVRCPVAPVNLYSYELPDGRKETHAYEWAHFTCDDGKRWVLKHTRCVGVKLTVSAEIPSIDPDRKRMLERARRIGFLSGHSWPQEQLEKLAGGCLVVIGKAHYAACGCCDKVVRMNKPLLGSIHFCAK